MDFRTSTNIYNAREPKALTFAAENTIIAHVKYYFKGENSVKIAVDRIEGSFAVCVSDNITVNERNQIFTLPVSLFPYPPQEGDIFEFSIISDPEEKKIRESRFKSKLNNLFNKGENLK
jgi:Protein of unknown function (DUF3006).